MKASDRLTRIKYQFKKNFNQGLLTDHKKVDAVRSLLDAQISATDVVSNVAAAPASLFGVAITWNPDGKNVVLVTDTVTLSDNLADVVIPAVPADPAGILYVYNGTSTEAFKLSTGDNLQLIVA